MNKTDKLLRALIDALGYEVNSSPGEIVGEYNYKVTKKASKSVSMQILHHKKEIERLIKDNANL